MKNNIPENIVNMVERLNNSSDSFWIRNNVALTLMDINDYIAAQLKKFNMQATINIKKEQNRTKV